MRHTHDALIDRLLQAQATTPAPLDDDALLAALAAPDSPDPEEIAAFVQGTLPDADAARVRAAIQASPLWLREYQDACFLLDAAPEAAPQPDPLDALVARLTGWLRSLAPAPLPALTAALADGADDDTVQLTFPDGVRGALIPDGATWRLVLESELWAVGAPLALTVDAADGTRLAAGVARVADGLLGAEASLTIPAQALAGVHEVAVAVAPIPHDALTDALLAQLDAADTTP